MNYLPGISSSIGIIGMGMCYCLYCFMCCASGPAGEHSSWGRDA